MTPEVNQLPDDSGNTLPARTFVKGEDRVTTNVPMEINALECAGWEEEFPPAATDVLENGSARESAPTDNKSAERNAGKKETKNG